MIWGHYYQLYNKRIFGVFGVTLVKHTLSAINVAYMAMKMFNRDLHQKAQYVGTCTYCWFAYILPKHEGNTIQYVLFDEARSKCWPNVPKIHIIQIWTYDQGNMEFCGSQATLLTKVRPRSIFLLNIHKTHNTWHLRSIFALLYVTCLLLKPFGLYILYCKILLNTLLSFRVL